MTVDEALPLAIAEHAEWYRAALPSAGDPQPRVFFYDGEHVQMKRPFKRKGHWCVRHAGIARLTQPFRGEDGWLCFKLDRS